MSSWPKFGHNRPGLISIFILAFKNYNNFDAKKAFCGILRLLMYLYKGYVSIEQ